MGWSAWQEAQHGRYTAAMYLGALGEGAVGYAYHTYDLILARDFNSTPTLALAGFHGMQTHLGTATAAGTGL